MRYRSKAMERTYRARRPLVARLLEERPLCERCCEADSIDIHERARRSQSSKALMDVENLVALCRTCHTWLGEHPTQAVAEGFSQWGWEYRQSIGETGR